MITTSGINSTQGCIELQRMESQEKEVNKDREHIGKLIRENSEITGAY